MFLDLDHRDVTQTLDRGYGNWILYYVRHLVSTIPASIIDQRYLQRNSPCDVGEVCEGTLFQATRIF